MKTLKKMVMAMVAICMSISFMACETDDHKTENINLKGRWYSKTETVNNLLIINDDNSVVTYKVSDYESWESINGNLTVDGNKVNIYFQDGNTLAGTATLQDSILIISTTNGEYRYSRLAEETNLTGDWNYSNITYSAKPIKDEIVIPGGIINGEEVPPTVMQTSQISGKFIEYAAQRYFRNIKFENGTMTYSVLKVEQEVPMSKNYSINGLNMTITGETAGHDIESAFMVLQSYDKNTAYFIFNKETIAEMFTGFALMLLEGGVAPEVNDEALEAYKKAFTEAFDYYKVEFVITRAN
jgi:hypothetical protein